MNGLKEFVDPQLREKNLTFSVVNECDDLTALGDEDKVRQILINLLSNAIKFTEKGGSIGVRCIIDDGTFKVSVTDDGIGIPRDKLSAIFEPFVQVGRDFSSPQGGTGLGLSISRDLARRMGGDLEVESQLGKGSTFTLTLRRKED
jgi:signal transduction histidine kinase